MPKGKSAKERLHNAHVAAPAGINSVDPAAELDPKDGIYITNLISGTLGLEVRPGTTAWTPRSDPGTPAYPGVRSLIPFYGATPAQDRLFAATSRGINDITTQGVNGTNVVVFGTESTISGYCTSVVVTTIADRYLLVADEQNGLYMYAESTQTWTAPGASGITGVSASAIAFVTQWRSRVWLVEKNTSRAWYLGLGAISGAATQFDFGPLFPYGGSLLGLYSWTVDGGAGMNDFLVAVSTSGDVVVFNPGDPAGTDFTQLGAWSLGGFPVGRDVAITFGGDILLLTLQGIVPLSKLVSGQLVTPDTYETRNIRPYYVGVAALQSSLRGWGMRIHPTKSLLIINMPGAPGQPQEQLAMSFATRGWTRLKGVGGPSSTVQCMEVWHGVLYLGMNTATYDVLGMYGTIDQPSPGNEVLIESSVLSGFLTQGSATKKKLALLRGCFITHGVQPAFQPIVRYDYDLTELTGSPVAPPGSLTDFTWDDSAWDEDYWQSTTGTGLTVVASTTGIGSALAVGGLMRTRDYCVLVGFDVWWEEGGTL